MLIICTKIIVFFYLYEKWSFALITDLYTVLDVVKSPVNLEKSWSLKISLNKIFYVIKYAFEFTVN